MTLGIWRKKRRKLKSNQLENFVDSVFIIISKVFFLAISIFYTSIYFQRYQEHPNQSSDHRVMALRSWSKNRGLQQHRDVENQRREVAETEHPDVATLMHDVAAFGAGFEWIFSPF